jgi:hypothetical protein
MQQTELEHKIGSHAKKEENNPYSTLYLAADRTNLKILEDTWQHLHGKTRLNIIV